jgi:alkylation response protein AidB-like acyl-CoA dehydrogenase
MSLATGANCAWTMYPGLSRAALNVVNLKGDEFMKNSHRAKMMTGKWGGTMCLTEPGAGSDVGALRTTAQPLPNGKYAIKGTKIFISSGESDLYENNIHLFLPVHQKVAKLEQKAFHYSSFLVLRSILMDLQGCI